MGPSVDLTMWGAGCVCGLAALLTRVLLVNSSVLKESKSDMKDNDDVLDLMEENISPVEDEYAGMMGALADIQTKGDSMLAGIRWQKEMLETLEQNLEKTEKKMEEAEKKTQNLEEEKVGLESDVWELQGKKNQLMMEMETEKEEMVRLHADLEPLEEQLATRKSELDNFKSAVVSKKNELADYNNQLKDVNTNLSSLKTTTGDVSNSFPPLVFVAGISLLLNLVVGIQLANTMMTGQSREGLEDVQNAGHDWVKKLLNKETTTRRRRKQSKSNSLSRQDAQ